MSKAELLITPTSEHAWKEVIHEDFVSREEFINRTGIFVSPEHFEFIYDMEFKDSSVSLNEFIRTYEEEHGGEVAEVPLLGTFKYMIMDDTVNCFGECYDDLHEPNIWEIVNFLARSQAMEHQTKWEYVQKYKKTLEESIQMLTALQASFGVDVTPSKSQPEE